MVINIPIKKRQEQQAGALVQQPVVLKPSVATTPQKPASVPLSDVQQQSAPQPHVPPLPNTKPIPVQQPTVKTADVSKMNDAQKAEFYMQSYSKGSSEPRQITLQDIQTKYNEVPKPQYTEAPAKLDYEAILNKIVPVPETPKQEQLRKRRAKANAYLSALGDGIASIANLVATTKYAPNAYDGMNTLSERARLRYEKNKDKIEALQKERRMAEYQMTKAKYDDDWKRADYANNIEARKRAEAMQDAQNLAHLYGLETTERNAKEQRDLVKAKWYREQDNFNKQLADQRKARAAATRRAYSGGGGRGRRGGSNDYQPGADIVLGSGKYEARIPSEIWFDDDYIVDLFNSLKTKEKGMFKGMKNLYNNYKNRMGRIVGSESSLNDPYWRDFSQKEKAAVAREFFDHLYGVHVSGYEEDKKTPILGTYSPSNLNNTSKHISEYVARHGVIHADD